MLSAASCSSCSQDVCPFWRGVVGSSIRSPRFGAHGITNDRLDEVSNFYRYRPEDGELWRHAPARAKAIIEDGRVTGFRITSSGSGYTTPPRVTVAGHEDLRVEATLGFSTDLRENGRVTELKIIAD